MYKTYNNNIYIVMYHYVRNIQNSKYPNLKGLEFSDFKKQVLYFKKNFNILSNSDFIEVINSKKIPKKKSILLTFDDGYRDHYDYVFPFLKKQKISANLYPPILCIKNKLVLDVNKIHFILEKESDRKKILELIFFYIKKIIKKKPSQLNIEKINLISRYDDKETVLIKRLLQYHLPATHRGKIVNKVFEEIVNKSEKQFSKILYMNENNIKELYQNNFTIGSHGYEHNWWGKISNKKQELEIIKSLNFFRNIGVFDKNFSVCFPYGSYNSHTLKILNRLKIKFALTTKIGSVQKNNFQNLYELPRLDTNDFK